MKIYSLRTALIASKFYRHYYIPALIASTALFGSPNVSAVSLMGVDAGGFVSGVSSAGSRGLDDERDISAVHIAGNFTVHPSDAWVLFADVRYLSNAHTPYSNNVREAYADYQDDRFGVRIGKQIIAWGRADRFNPTDNLTPRNYQILSADDDDQRFGTVGVSVVAYLPSALSITGIMLPGFASSQIPSGSLPANIAVIQPHEDNTLNDLQWGLKLGRAAQGLDWSLSHYEGWSLLPELALGPTGLVLRNSRMRASGADFAVGFTGWGLRGEAAKVQFERPTDGSLYPHSYLYTVLGVEFTSWESATVNMQWLHRRIDDFQDPRQTIGPFAQVALANASIHNQFDHEQNGVAVRISRLWRNDTIRAEFAVAKFFQHGDYVLRPKIEYAINDSWRAVLMADIYRGPQDSFLGSLRKNSLTYAELRYQF